MASSRLFAGAAALVLFTSIACGGGGGGAPVPPEPLGPASWTGPADEGTVTARARIPQGGSFGTGLDTVNARTVDVCITGQERRLPAAPRVVRRLARPFTQAEAAELLGASDPLLRARDYAEGSLDDTAAAFVGDPRSVTLLYGAEVRTGTSALDLATAAFYWPTLVAPGTPEFAARCGDQVLVERELGVQAFMLFKFSFASDAARAAFDRLVGVDVPLWELEPRLTAASAGELRGKYLETKWRLSQLGGDPTALLHHVGTAQEFVEYVTTDGPNSLVAQAQASPGAVGYTFEPWQAVTVAAAAPREAPPAGVAARAALVAQLEDRLEVLGRMGTLYLLGHPFDMAAAQVVVHWDVDILRAALEACYALGDPDGAAALARCTAAASPEGLAAAGFRGTPALADL